MKPKLKWAIFLEGRNISKACWDFNQEGARWDLLGQNFCSWWQTSFIHFVLANKISSSNGMQNDAPLDVVLERGERWKISFGWSSQLVFQLMKKKLIKKKGEMVVCRMICTVLCFWTELKWKGKTFFLRPRWAARNSKGWWRAGRYGMPYGMRED